MSPATLSPSFSLLPSLVNKGRHPNGKDASPGLGHFINIFLWSEETTIFSKPLQQKYLFSLWEDFFPR